MPKVTIERKTEREEYQGKTYQWHIWRCSCGASARYLNYDAMVAGSITHGRMHSGTS